MCLISLNILENFYHDLKEFFFAHSFVDNIKEKKIKMQLARMDLNELSSLDSRDDMEFPSITPLKRTISPSKKVRVSSYYSRLKIVNRLLRFGDI